MVNLRKISYLNLIFLGLCEGVLNPVINDSTISRAFHEIANEFFVKSQIPFDVINIRETSRVSNFSVNIIAQV